jgi:hypothetical protein
VRFVSIHVGAGVFARVCARACAFFAFVCERVCARERVCALMNARVFGRGFFCLRFCACASALTYDVCVCVRACVSARLRSCV